MAGQHTYFHDYLPCKHWPSKKGPSYPGGSNPMCCRWVIFNVLLTFNREALGIEVDFSLPSERVIRTLKQIIGWRGKPSAIRCDNGPEYLSAAIVEWADAWGIKLEYIQPGQPQQNAYVERFNRTVRYEWLSQYHWDDLDHVQRIATQWMWSYNHERPNMALGGFTPKQRLAMAT
nr:integrase core domain-containing protein [Burkholderia multivorans]